MKKPQVRFTLESAKGILRNEAAGMRGPFCSAQDVRDAQALVKWWKLQAIKRAEKAKGKS